jgi:hypothetical protein
VQHYILTHDSYGSYFLTQLLGASSIAPLEVSTGFYPPFEFENLDDDRFNIRDANKGYNMDFMSYANLFQANMDPNVLLDTDVLLNVLPALCKSDQVA